METSQVSLEKPSCKVPTLHIATRSLIKICPPYSSSKQHFFEYENQSKFSRFSDYLFSDKPGTTTAFPDAVSFNMIFVTPEILPFKTGLLVPYA